MAHEPLAAYLCYDPRDPAQCLDDRATWKRSTNGILISATMLHAARNNAPIDWEKVAVLADLSETQAFQNDDAEPLAGVPTMDETNAMLSAVLAKRQADFA